MQFVKSLILIQRIFVGVKLKKKNWKVFFGHQSLGTQTGLLDSKMASRRHWEQLLSG